MSDTDEAQPPERDPRAKDVHEATLAGDVERLRALFAAGVSPDVACPRDADEDEEDEDDEYEEEGEEGDEEDEEDEDGEDGEDGEDDRVVLLAVHGQDVEVFQAFLDAGVTLDGLLTAALRRFQGPRPYISALLAAGLDPNAPDAEGWPPLVAAAAAPWAAVEALETLLEGGARPDSRTTGGETALHAAISSAFGNLEAARLLVERGVPLDAEADDGVTAYALCDQLRRHSSGNYDEIMDLLREAGARTTTGSSKRDALLDALRRLEREYRRPIASLSEAAAEGDESLVRAFLADGQAPDEPFSESFYPIERAFAKGHQAIVDLLLAEGAAPRSLIRDPEEDARREKYRKLRAALEAETAPKFSRAGEGPERDELEREAVALIEAGALDPDPAAARVGSEPILCFAAEHGLTRVVEALLVLGLPVNGPDDPEQLTPLVLAARRGHADACRALLAAGADPSLSRDDRFVPITGAAEIGDLGLVKALVEAGADLEFVGAAGQTPVNVAAGPQRNAIRTYLRQHRSEALLGARAPALVFKRRKRMYAPDQLHGADEYGQYAPSPWPRWALRADVDAVCDALEAAAPGVAVERGLGTAPVLAALRFAILFQLEGSDWTLVSAEGITPAVAHERLGATARRLEALACAYHHERLWVTLGVLEPGAEALRKLGPDELEPWFREVRLWIPPHSIEGDGPQDSGWHNHLRLHGLRREHLVAAHRVVWQW